MYEIVTTDSRENPSNYKRFGTYTSLQELEGGIKEALKLWPSTLIRAFRCLNVEVNSNVTIKE